MARAKRLISDHSIVEIDTLSDTPEPGQWGFKGGVFYIYATIGTISTWFPLNIKMSTYVHTQGTANAQWVINHGLNSKNVMVMVYDANNNLIDAAVHHVQDAATSEWSTIIDFAAPQDGYAVVFGSTEFAVPVISSNIIAADTAMTIGGVNVVTTADLSNYISVNDTIDLGIV